MVNDKNHLYTLADLTREAKIVDKIRTQQQFSRFSTADVSALIQATALPPPVALQIDTKPHVGDPYNDTYGDIGFITQIIFLDVFGSNYNIISVNGDITFAFDKIPQGRHIEFTIDMLINTGTPPTILFPSEVENPPTLPTLTDGLRVILHFEGVRDDVNTRFVYIGGTVDTAGAVTFPIIPPVDVRGNVSTTQDIDLSLTTAHTTTMTLTGNISITFSNFPATANQIEWEVEIKQDGVGGRTVSWPAAVTPVPVIDTTAGNTTIVVLRTNDNGTIIRTIADGSSLTSPLTTKGDVFGFSTVDARIPVGTNNNVFMADSGQALGVKYALIANANLATGVFGAITGLGAQTQDFDMNTSDIFDIDQLTFMGTVGTLGSLNVGFGAVGSGSFRGNILDAGRFEWTEENVELMRLSEATSITTLDITGILSGGIDLNETTTGKVGSILQGATTLQYTTTGTQHEFVVGVGSILFINSSGIAMQGTNFITTPQIGFSILGNLIEDDAGGLIITCVPGDDITFDDGTTIFGTIDADLFGLNAIPMQLTKIATPTDPGSITLGKVFFNTADNRLTFRRRNDGDTAWVNIDLEAGAGGVQDKIEEGDSKVEVIDTGTGQVDIFVDGATAKFRFLVAGFSPVVAGAVNLGTSSLPWEKLSIKDIEIETGGTPTATKNNIVAGATGIVTNVPSGGVHTFRIAGTDTVIIDEDEIRFQAGRAHKIVATGSELQLVTENSVDDLVIFTGSGRSNATIRVEDDALILLTTTTTTNVPQIRIIQNNNTPADSREIGDLIFIAEDTASVDRAYAGLLAFSLTVSSTDIQGGLQLVVASNNLEEQVGIAIFGDTTSNIPFIGFFGANPVAQQQLDADPTNAEISTALRNLGLTKL